MVFSSDLFLFAFFPVFVLVYVAVAERWRNATVLLGSLAFYTVGAGSIVVVLLGSIWLNQFLAPRLADTERAGRRLLLAGGIAVNLAALIYYKYTGFGWQVVSAAAQQLADLSLPSAPQIVLPIGISFFTFQAISYLIDVYRGDVRPARGYFEFAVYHTLFPQLVAGPIVRYAELRERLGSHSLDLAHLTEGAYRICLGLGKKIVLADNLGAVADQIMRLPANELSCAHAWLGIVCYSFQIYYDFSGYSDMAIGLGKLLGFDFPENFNQPYRAASITEFWRRWHMTLSRWFRDYVYIPMGGNRHGQTRTYLNLAAVFVLCGLWHGAAVSFLLWGLYHGSLLVIERVLDRRFDWRPSGPVAVAASFALVTIGWVLFRIDDPGAALTYFRALFMAGTADTNWFPNGYFLDAQTAAYLVLASLFAWLPIEKFGGLRPERVGVFAAQLGFAAASFALALVQLASNSFNPFIYFRF